MQNDRPLNDPRMQEALNIIAEVYRMYDLAGGAYVVNEDEVGFTYAMYTSWNATVEDSSLPLGFRIRVNESEMGRERAEKLMTGTARTVTAMKDFGMQSVQWANDLLKIIRKAGFQISYTPFGGDKPKHIVGMDMRNKK
jgi:hypothetical protein